MPGPFPNRVKPHRISEINAVPFQQVPVASLCMMHRNATLKKTRTKNLQYKKTPLLHPCQSYNLTNPYISTYISTAWESEGNRREWWKMKPTSLRTSPVFSFCLSPSLCLSEENYHYCCLNRRGISYDWIQFEI